MTSPKLSQKSLQNVQIVRLHCHLGLVAIQLEGEIYFFLWSGEQVAGERSLDPEVVVHDSESKSQSYDHSCIPSRYHS